MKNFQGSISHNYNYKTMNLIKLNLAGVYALLFSGLVAQENPLWLRYPSISPDGQTIAFCYKGDIFLVSSKGGKATQLTTHPGYDSRPVWSPDGKTIAFTSQRNNAMDLFTIPVGGGTPRQLTTFSGSATPECFTPAPKIRSTVLLFTPKTEIPAAETLAKVEKITSLAFGQRRKMLRQSLKAMPGLLDKCRDLGIAPTARAEALPPEAFLRLAEN